MAEKKKELKKRTHTEVFTQVIKDHLDKQAKEDKLFAKTYAKKNKNIDDCVKYVLEAVKKLSDGGGMMGLTDDEVFNMATHYYDEDDIDMKNIKVGDMKIVYNKKIELNDDEIELARQEAKNKVIQEESSRIKNAGKKKTSKPEKKDDKPVQQSLI